MLSSKGGIQLVRQVGDKEVYEVTTLLLRILQLVRLQHRQQHQICLSRIRRVLSLNIGQKYPLYPRFLQRTTGRRNRPYSLLKPTTRLLESYLRGLARQVDLIFQLLKRQFETNDGIQGKFVLSALATEMFDPYSDSGTTGFQFYRVAFPDATIPKELVWEAVIDKMQEKFHKVMRLAFKQASLSQKSLIHLFQKLTTLQDLKINGQNAGYDCTKVTPQSLGWLCSSNPTLKILSLDQCNIGDAAGLIIANGLKMLTDLYLRENNLTDKSVVPLAKNLRHLKKLGLKRNEINEGLLTIAEHQRQLTLLYISVPITDPSNVIGLVCELGKIQILQIEITLAIYISLSAKRRQLLSYQTKHLCPTAEFT